MHRSYLCAAISISLVALAPSPTAAASLSVIPISLEVVQPGSIGTLTLRNHEVRPLNAQVRVFRWTQVDGADRLEPDDEVVASPPIVTINAGSDYAVRLQRVAASDVTGEEAYRVVVDELPDPNRQRNGMVTIVLRYLVPVFFLSPDATPPRLVWSVQRRARSTLLTATNAGDKRIQIVDLKLRIATGRTIVIAKGLAGYVLGHSTRVWAASAKVRLASEGVVVAQSDHGPIRAPLSR